MPDKKQLTIQINAKLHPSPEGEKVPQVVAYAFTGTGRLISQASIDEKGNAALAIPDAQEPQEVRILVGPAQQSADQATTLGDLTRRGVPENFLRVAPQARDLSSVFEIPSDIWRCWLRFCLVRGTLLKRIYSSGIAIDYPVCNADVQIWEVDPIYIVVPKLPDFDLERLRQYLVNPQPLPPGPNPPDPAPFERVQNFARLGQMEIAQPMKTSLRSFSTASPEFESIHRVALTGDLAALRQSLVTVNSAALQHLFCALFPRFVTKRLIGTATTDRCGHFSRFVSRSCNDAVDLYFTASINVWGFAITIYQPTPVSCYTYWNYKCGTEVTLFTNSPFAPTCTPCPPVDAPENYVLIRALGNVQLNGIYGTSTLLTGSTNSTNIGQAANLYSPGLDSPFGGTVLPRIEFDSSLRATGKAMYYQVSYRQGTSGTFIPLAGSIDRKYNHFVGTDLVTSVYNLGPKVAGGVANLFEIPPALPPVGDWAYPNPPVDLANAVFPTESLPTPVSGGTFGKYQLKVDLFDSAGNAVNIATTGIRYFVPTTVDPDGTIHTADAATLGLVSGNSFIMTVHIDNRHTFGALGTPALDGTPADSCGVFRYNAGPSGTVTIPYTASHLDNFATFSYRIVRGATPLTPPTTSGKVSGATNPAIVTMSVVSLLTQPDSTICDVAGFAEDLYVAALATDGWSRLSGLDSSPGPRAFVLAPKP